MTESHLSKQFVKETGEHFIEHVTKLRINEAARLIESDMRMYEIALKVGYENPEHFSRVFKKYRGMSPQKYRDAYAWKKK
ncbi:helix-turn-helix transcriptional regulator [Paenibacillus aestuarii]|uniref:helix-turn-helix transcriptional regulator n=1 Tax=Paenibacillus aestuarii TaxID=516965 RepID=UPI0022E9C047|nr:helix-turn-helix transcriptional regulator [Paenibacillus aestuarii]